MYINTYTSPSSSEPRVSGCAPRGAPRWLRRRRAERAIYIYNIYIYMYVYV